MVWPRLNDPYVAPISFNQYFKYKIIQKKMTFVNLSIPNMLNACGIDGWPGFTFYVRLLDNMI